MKNLRFASVLLASAAAVAALPMSAAAEASPADAAVAGDSLIVVRDADTGELRAATASEASALLTPRASSARRSAAPVESATVIRHSNGMMSAKVPDELLMSLQATHEANGKIVESHGEISTTSDALPTE